MREREREGDEELLEEWEGAPLTSWKIDEPLGDAKVARRLLEDTGICDV
jgi:hypothetical protein